MSATNSCDACMDLRLDPMAGTYLDNGPSPGNPPASRNAVAKALQPVRTNWQRMDRLIRNGFAGGGAGAFTTQIDASTVLATTTTLNFAGGNWTATTTGTDTANVYFRLPITGYTDASGTASASCRALAIGKGIGLSGSTTATLEPFGVQVDGLSSEEANYLADKLIIGDGLASNVAGTGQARALSLSNAGVVEITAGTNTATGSVSLSGSTHIEIGTHAGGYTLTHANPQSGTNYTWYDLKPHGVEASTGEAYQVEVDAKGHVFVQRYAGSDVTLPTGGSSTHTASTFIGPATQVQRYDQWIQIEANVSGQTLDSRDWRYPLMWMVNEYYSFDYPSAQPEGWNNNGISYGPLFRVISPSATGSVSLWFSGALAVYTVNVHPYVDGADGGKLKLDVTDYTLGDPINVRLIVEVAGTQKASAGLVIS